MINIVNKKEFFELIRKYESITINQLEDMRKKLEDKGQPCNFGMDDILCEITGFGTMSSCTLCKVARFEKESYVNCKACIYSLIQHKEGQCPCCRNQLEESYCAIESSHTIYNLHDSIQLRIKDLKQFIKDFNLTED